MTRQPTPTAIARRHAITALAATPIMAIATAAPARAASPPGTAPPVLPAQLTSAIATVGLAVQTNSGWEAVTGPATTADGVRALASMLGVANLAEYTYDDQTGYTILIFPGDNDSSTGFKVQGATANSATNDTNQTWAITTNDDQSDAILRPGTAEDITPVHTTHWNPVGDQVTTYVSFRF